MTEAQYIVWGVAPGGDMETLLVSDAANLFGYAAAVQVCYKLEHEYGCRDLRAERLAPLGNASEIAAMFRASVNG